MVSSMLKHTTFQKFFDHTNAKILNGVCASIAYCVTAFETVFCGLIFGVFLFITAKVPNISVLQYGPYSGQF